MNIANEFVVQLIREQARKPNDIVITYSAEWEMFSYDLTIYDVCDAIVDWIDNGKDVEQDVTRFSGKHQDKLIYIFKPIRVNQLRCYIKVSFGNSGLGMVLVSIHKYEERKE